MNAVKMKETGILKKQTNYEASLKLKENAPPYYEAQKLPVHLLPLVVAKLRKLVEQEDLLEIVPPGGSKVTIINSPIGLLRCKGMLFFERIETSRR